MSKERVFIKVEGIVQGVGFRPFVYNLAISLNLNGWVNNNSEGVYIDIEGDADKVKSFMNNLRHNPPPLSRIENITTEPLPLSNYTAFTIKESERSENTITLISPDIATCADCTKDILDPANRRYKYPFTNCTNCGPRFSIIKSIPYDRDKTTMKDFIMCSECEDEYTNPLNRRFHAQPNACRECGPTVWLEDNKGAKIEGAVDTITYAQKLLNEGKILAVKGLCGFHLVCNGKNDNAIKLLRERKLRPHKPFAVMMKDIATASKYCMVNSLEEDLLTGIRKPIVLLNQKKDYNLPQSIAPNQKTLGVMLPYTPLHQLLFSGDIEVLIMTSANIYGLPLEYDNESARENLSSLVDFFLMHNRDIYIPVDDSVVKVVNNELRMIRRARGYAPEPFKANLNNKILACGPNMKNTFSLAKDNLLFVSQHNGDLENIETFNHYKRNIEHFKDIFLFSPEYIACDLHPKYTSTQYAEEYDLPLIAVQHHHAHIASCLVENHIDKKVIGIAYDGTGYGTDNKIWGGEFLICDMKSFSRAAHLDYVKIPGGEKAIEEPWRMGVSYLYSTFEKSEASNNELTIDNLKDTIVKLYGTEASALIKILDKNINCIETSSMGRLFDAVSSMLNIRKKVTYEGQASIELEAVIEKDCEEYYNYSISHNRDKNIYNIEVYKTILEILDALNNNISVSTISSKFHNTVIHFTLEMCKILREETAINDIVLSGGVFQNSYLLEKTIKILKGQNFTVHTHSEIPSNDGGISVGQLAIANELINFKCK